MITFSASPGNLATATFLAVASVAVLAGLEWRRPDSRRRAGRISATAAAVSALALLALHPSWRPRAPSSRAAQGMVAELWTAGGATAAADPVSNIDYRIALPGATASPPGTVVVPDAGTLRRRFPEVATVHVFGNGLDSGDLEALRGLRLVFHPPEPETSSPAILSLRAPGRLPLGEPLVLEGRVGGLRRGNTAVIALENPDGKKVETVASAADATGQASFIIRADAPAAVGHFVWRVSLLGAPASQALGVDVIQPALPRVLVLESSPHFDTADLRRWFAGAGGWLVSRTLVGQNRYRFASSTSQAAPEFPAFDMPLLAGVDLVVADAAALAALAPAECEALRTAIAETGLGVLTLADEAAPDKFPAPALFPWRLTARDEATPEESAQLARPEWAGQLQTIATPIPVAPLSLAPLPGQAELIRDGQGRTLAATRASGRGQLGLTLLQDSGRWLRSRDPGAFGAYWSFLFSRLARPIDSASVSGNWTSAGTDGPIFTGEPLTLFWHGATSPLRSAEVVGESRPPQDNATLSLRADQLEPDRWRGTFWPRRAGWYTVFPPAGSVGASLSFFVGDAASWPGIAAERRRLATARFAQASFSPPKSMVPGPAGKGNTAAPAACFFVLFVASAGFLWAERRL